MPVSGESQTLAGPGSSAMQPPSGSAATGWARARREAETSQPLVELPEGGLLEGLLGLALDAGYSPISSSLG